MPSFKGISILPKIIRKHTRFFRSVLLCVWNDCRVLRALTWSLKTWEILWFSNVLKVQCNACKTWFSFKHRETRNRIISCLNIFNKFSKAHDTLVFFFHLRGSGRYINLCENKWVRKIFYFGVFFSLWLLVNHQSYSVSRKIC